MKSIARLVFSAMTAMTGTTGTTGSDANQPTVPDTWITDTALSSRFPYYTRANADEVGPDPFSPLGWSLGWAKGCIPGVAEGFASFGAVRMDEFALDPPEVFGNWGGYFYNQLSLPRVMGCRMPGASPEAIDQAYFGDQPGVPPYIAHPEDDDDTQAAILGEKMAWVMSTNSYPLQDAASTMSLEAVATRPKLADRSNGELVARARLMAGLLREAWLPYCEVCLSASLGPGAVQAICGAIGRSGDAVRVLSAIGDVESAEASFAMWDISRLIRGSAPLMAAFDGDPEGVPARLGSVAAAEGVAFRSAWGELLSHHGHRGPNEWDMRAHSWTTKPELALSMLERLRFQDDARSPHEARIAAAVVREKLTAELLATVEADVTAYQTLVAGLASAKLFFGLREMGKNACIRLIHEAKLAMFELGNRMVDAGVLNDTQDVFMLLDAELDGFLANPALLQSELRLRAAQLACIAKLEPPYIVNYDDGVAPISTWKVRGGGADAGPVEVGTVLQGAGGAPGTAVGVARVVLDPSDARELEPDDIMIAPTTDPSWTPLFLAVAAVVVNVGAVASHAAIVCRELGVPCAVSVVRATDRIPDGATISVDGSSGTVTILSLP